MFLGKMSVNATDMTYPKSTPDYLLGGTLFYCRSLIFFQFLLLLVVICHYFQYWNCNFPIFACLNLPSPRESETLQYARILCLYHGNNQDSTYEISVV